MTGIFDLHIHPTLKMHYLPLLNKTFHAAGISGRFWNPLSFRTKYANVTKGNHKVMMVAHHVIEKDFITRGMKPLARGAVKAIIPLFYRRILKEEPWKVLMKQMEILEDSQQYTNVPFLSEQKKLVMVKNIQEVENLKENEIGMIHALEGTNAFGVEPQPGQTLDEYWELTKKRLAYLRKRGMAMISPSHFADNMFLPQADSTEQIPKKINGTIKPVYMSTHRMWRGNWKYGDPNKLSEQFIKEMMRLGITIDLVHTQEHARWKVYELCEQYKRPVVISHVGLQHFFKNEYNVSDEELRQIAKLGGVVGLILSLRWLLDPLKAYGHDGKGIDFLVENILYFKDLLGTLDNVGIGTDFDGLTYPFKDLHTPAELGKIEDALARYCSDDEIEKVLFGNSWRVIKKAWHEPQKKLMPLTK